MKSGTWRQASEGRFGEGGCTVDVDQDGRLDLVLQRGLPLGSLVWLRAPEWSIREIDQEVGMHDCLPADLFGRRGILMIQRYSQVRFYEHAGKGEGSWPYREIYSIYTASNQAALAVRDVDRDGRPDILCGNYWLRSPARFDLPWRLFAVNLWHETKESAAVRLAAAGEYLVAAQAHSSPARVAVFRRPSPPTRLWEQQTLEVAGGLHFPHGMLLARAADGSRITLLAENHGPQSRIFWITDPAQPHLGSAAAGHGVHTLLDGGEGKVLAAGPGAISTWTLYLRK
jgi:hypothetical protein